MRFFFLLVLAVFLLMFIGEVAFFNLAPATLKIGTVSVSWPLGLSLVVAAAFGLAAGTILNTIFRRDPEGAGWPWSRLVAFAGTVGNYQMAVFLLAVFLFAAALVQPQQFSLISAAGVFIFGTVALIASLSIVQRLVDGDSFEIQSSWGGLGGGLGGWRMSPVTALALVCLVFASATAMAVEWAVHPAAAPAPPKAAPAQPGSK